jgi:hypothetical protein
LERYGSTPMATAPTAVAPSQNVTVPVGWGARWIRMPRVEASYLGEMPQPSGDVDCDAALRCVRNALRGLVPTCREYPG